MKIIYISGAYRAQTIHGIVENIRRAEAVALDFARRGWGFVCPHKNSGLLDGAMPEEHWLEMGMEMLRRCDAIALVPGWERSEGTKAEVREAVARGMEVWQFCEECGWVEDHDLEIDGDVIVEGDGDVVVAGGPRTLCRFGVVVHGSRPQAGINEPCANCSHAVSDHLCDWEICVRADQHTTDCNHGKGTGAQCGCREFVAAGGEEAGP